VQLHRHRVLHTPFSNSSPHFFLLDRRGHLVVAQHPCLPGADPPPLLLPTGKEWNAMSCFSSFDRHPSGTSESTRWPTSMSKTTEQMATTHGDCGCVAMLLHGMRYFAAAKPPTGLLPQRVLPLFAMERTLW
jgi:hypothetical protein